MLNWWRRAVPEVHCYWGMEYLIMQHLKPKTYTWQGPWKPWFAVPRHHFALWCNAPFCQQYLWLVTAVLLGGYRLHCLNPTLTPCHFRLSGSLKNYLTGKWFASDTDVKQAVISWLHTHTLNTNLFYTWIHYKNVSGDYMKVWFIAHATYKLMSQYSCWHQSICYHIFSIALYYDQFVYSWLEM